MKPCSVELELMWITSGPAPGDPQKPRKAYSGATCIHRKIVYYYKYMFVYTHTRRYKCTCNAIFSFERIFRKGVVAFITFLSFAVSAGICAVLSSKLLQLLLLEVDLATALPIFKTLFSRTS